jgi:hypothetical protein
MNTPVTHSHDQFPFSRFSSEFRSTIPALAISQENVAVFFCSPVTRGCEAYENAVDWMMRFAHR